MSQDSIKADPYAPWRIHDYRCYACSWFAMMFSKQIEKVAITIYFVSIFSTSDAPLALGVMGLVMALPVILLAIAAGQLADRFDRRLVVMISLALGTLSVVGLLIVVLLNASAPWIFLMLGLGAIGQAIGSPSRAALLPQLVPAEIFSNAVAWNSSVFSIASVTGPVVGGFVMHVSKAPNSSFENPAVALSVVLVCRVIALGAISLVRHRRSSRSEESMSWQSVVAGIRFVWRTKLILATITMDMFAVLLGGATYLLPIFAKEILHIDSIGLGFLFAADAIGAISMAVLLAHLPPLRRAGVTLLCAVAGYGAATIVFGLSQWFWLSLLMMFLVGALDNISVVVRHTLVQMLTPDEMRGRVSAVNGMFIVASNDIGGLESGLTAWLVGPVVSVVAGGVGTILVVLGAMRLWPQLLTLGSLDAIRPDPMEDPPDGLV
jgi:MFS family permease